MRHAKSTQSIEKRRYEKPEPAEKRGAWKPC